SFRLPPEIFHIFDCLFSLFSFWLVSSIQATMATLSGLVVIFSCRDVVNDRPYTISEKWLSNLFLKVSSDGTPTTSGTKLFHWLMVLPVRKFLLISRLNLSLISFHSLFLVWPSGKLKEQLLEFFPALIFLFLKMQDSLLHKINGILILVTFFLCRILLFPYMYWAYGQQMNIPIYKVPFHIPLHCNVANAFLIAPQMYWFALICRKAMRLYSNSQDGKP
uniref:TLC domain containing 3A n=1 Tax=Pseudonaja textilis TaxID=8673 RepID=A0A670YQP9_PSETE